MSDFQPMWKIHDEKFNRLWNGFQNGYKPPLYNPEQAAGCNGRKDSLTLSISINQPDVLERIEPVANAIRHIPGLYMMPPEYYHITVKWLGFLTDEKQFDNDLEPQTLEQILEQADSILSEIPEFSLRLGSVNGLASFIILEVEDNGAIAEIQGRFHEEATMVPSHFLEGEGWLPHLSIAAVESHDGLTELKAVMKDLRHIDIGEVAVSKISLIQATLKRPCPQCRQLKSFPLARDSRFSSDEFNRVTHEFTPPYLL